MVYIAIFIEQQKAGGINVLEVSINLHPLNKWMRVKTEGRDCPRGKLQDAQVVPRQMRFSKKIGLMELPLIYCRA